MIWGLLALDHLDDQGRADRERHGNDTGKLCHELKRLGFPPRFTVSCHNCNICRSIMGYCVHHPGTKPEGRYARKGGTSKRALVPLSTPADGVTTWACTKCNRVFPLDTDHFFKCRTTRTRLHTSCKGCFTARTNANARDRIARNRLRVFTHYCGGEPRCECCGITEPAFLSVDHIDGGGTRHREEAGFADVCDWLIRNGFPEGIRILCYSCNVGRRLGVCPHKMAHPD